MNKYYYVYIMASRSGVIYTGVTNDLNRRVYEHKNNLILGFSSKYKTHDLVYYEVTDDIESAIAREKQIKGWLRIKKETLIQKDNPQWRDLAEEIV